MPSKLIIDHYKKMNVIEEDINKKIDELVDQIDIESLIKNPEDQISLISESIIQQMKNDVIERSAELGIELGSKLKKMIDSGKKIEVEGGSSSDKEKAFSNVDPRF